MTDEANREDANQEDKGLRRGLTNYGDKDFSLYLRRSFAQGMGYSREMLDRPVVGIMETPSGYNPCHRNMPEQVEAVKRGVLAAGALPIVFPTISLGEGFLNPTSLMYRNLASMDTEEMARAQPMDALVPISGCDKTLPAQLMGLANADIPVVQQIVGPMMTGNFDGERVAACTDCRRYWGQYRAGNVDRSTIERVESRLATTAGSCGVMGTASTMACMTEALGIALPGTAAIPAVHSDRLRAAEASGRRAAEMALGKAEDRILPRDIITYKSVENAYRMLLAIGGSTNAIVHMNAIAGRLGIEVSMDRLNKMSDETPVLVDLKPTGMHYMEDLFAAGGVGAILRELKPLLHLDCMTITGETLGERLDQPQGYVDHGVVRPFNDPFQPQGGLVALFGSLAPRGAILKRSAADSNLFEREGRAVVFSSLEDLAARVDSDDLDIQPDDFMVLQNAGPKSSAGMPEAGYLPIPKKLARAGLKDMVRISDARMSGTAFGTIVLHVAPEAAIGGPLGLVRNGDRIKLSVENRQLELLVSEEELAQRRKARGADQIPHHDRGYRTLYYERVMQADGGADFDFLRHPDLR
jgi:dihydroxy-acid dehydratase